MGAGLLALIIFFLVLFPKDPETPGDRSPEASEDRLKQIEERLSGLEWMDERVTRVEERNKTLDSFAQRLDKIEASISSKTDEITKRLEHLEKKTAGFRARDTVTRKPVKVPETRKPSVRRTGVRFHEVRAGENLYQISRKYKLSVEELRRLNQLAPGAPIHPGEKLKVRE